MRWFETLPIGLIAIFCAVALSVVAETTKASRECNFDAYRPLRIGTPIRGGHEKLAVEKVAPKYPPEAQQKGIEGRVAVQVLINRAGDVIKACAVGERMLAIAAEEAVSKWKFQKDFGFTFADKSPAEPRFAVLSLSFNFKTTTGTQGQPGSKTSVDGWACAQKSAVATDEHRAPIWLSSHDLMRRVAQKSDLSFPMLGHGHLRGEVKLDLLIDERGSVACVSATSGHPIAIASAMETIRTWKFKPFIQSEKEIPVLGHLTIPYDVRR
jgi:TonB family protein